MNFVQAAAKTPGRGENRERERRRERVGMQATKTLLPTPQKEPSHQNSKTCNTKLMQTETHNKNNSVNPLQI